MNVEKDYYATLGVLPSIEPAALRAVYLALQKLYHPDVFVGDPLDSERRIKAINEAYSVLSDSTKRAQYDAARINRTGSPGSFSEETIGPCGSALDSEQSKAWAYVVSYYPSAETCRTGLAAISRALALQYQLTVLELKAARNADEVANVM